LFYYAQLNEQKICIGISSLAGDTESPDMIPVPNYSDDYMWRKFENGEWSTEKFPPPEPVNQKPLSEEVEDLKKADLDNKEAIASLFEMLLGGV